MGVSSSIDQEVLVNKLSTVTSELGNLEIPHRSSLLTIAETQQLASDLTTVLGERTSQDLYHITNFLGNLRGKVSLALSCIQSQLWLQSVAGAIIREGETGLLPQQVQMITARNHTTTKFQKTYQAW